MENAAIAARTDEMHNNTDASMPASQLLPLSHSHPWPLPPGSSDAPGRPNAKTKHAPAASRPEAPAATVLICIPGISKKTGLEGIQTDLHTCPKTNTQTPPINKKLERLSAELDSIEAAIAVAVVMRKIIIYYYAEERAGPALLSKRFRAVLKLTIASLPALLKVSGFLRWMKAIAESRAGNCLGNFFMR